MLARLSWRRNGAKASLALGDATVYVGSDPDCQVVGDEPGLARRHCRITHLGAGFRIEPLGGATQVNGVPVTVTSRALAYGDEIDCAGLLVHFDDTAASPVMPLPDAETQRLPPELARSLRAEAQRAPRAPEHVERIEALEQEVTKLWQELSRLAEENKRLREA